MGGLKYYVYPQGLRNPKKIVLLLHGYGSNGQDLISLAPEMQAAAKDILFVSPDAPFAFEAGFSDAYQWYGLSDRSHQKMFTEAELARPYVEELIDKLLREYKLKQSDLVVMGFSQGGMMTLHTQLQAAEKPKGVVVFSGYTVFPERLVDIDASKMPILLIHGTYDNVVPFSAFEATKSALEDLGFSPQVHTVNGLGHGIDYSCVNAASKFLHQVFTSEVYI